MICSSTTAALITPRPTKNQETGVTQAGKRGSIEDMSPFMTKRSFCKGVRIRDASKITRQGTDK
jgi:hypothetical protein